MKVYNKITDLIGNTPLLKLNSLIERENLGADVFAKLFVADAVPVKAKRRKTAVLVFCNTLV